MENSELFHLLPESWQPLFEASPNLVDVFLKRKTGIGESGFTLNPDVLTDPGLGSLQELQPVFALYGDDGLAVLKNLQEAQKPAGSAGKRYMRNGRMDIRTVPTLHELCTTYLNGIFHAWYDVGMGKPPLSTKRVQIGVPGDMTSRLSFQNNRSESDDTLDREVRTSLTDWAMGLEKKDGCEELFRFFSVPVYRLLNDWFLYHFVFWPIYQVPIEENPFEAHWKLRQMGFRPFFFSPEQIFLVG